MQKGATFVEKHCAKKSTFHVIVEKVYFIISIVFTIFVNVILDFPTSSDIPRTVIDKDIKRRCPEKLKVLPKNVKNIPFH